MKENALMFSVIVPVYKVEQYLRECLDSIINQTYKNFELILVDDGSPDKCPDICDEYAKKDSRIKVIHKKNEGVTIARRTGAEIAKGEYIVCVDSDDLLDSTYLLEFSKIINKYNSDIICCGFISFFSDKSKKINYLKNYGYYNKERIKKEIFPILIRNNIGEYFSPSLCTKALKKELFLRSQKLVNPIIKIGEDDLCSKFSIYKADSIFILNKYLYYYRVNIESVTKRKEPFQKNLPKLLAENYRKYLPQEEFEDQIARLVVHSLFVVLSSMFNQNKKYKEIKKEINELLMDEYYRASIKNCYFRIFSKERTALYVLKYRKIFLIYLYNNIKKLKRR